MMLVLFLVQSLCSSGPRAKVTEKRGREEVPLVRGCMGKGVKEDMMLVLFLVQSLCSSGPRARLAAEEASWV